MRWQHSKSVWLSCLEDEKFFQKSAQNMQRLYFVQPCFATCPLFFQQIVDSGLHACASRKIRVITQAKGGYRYIVQNIFNSFQTCKNQPPYETQIHKVQKSCLDSLKNVMSCPMHVQLRSTPLVNPPYLCTELGCLSGSAEYKPLQMEGGVQMTSL